MPRGVDPRFPAAAVPAITGLHLSPGGRVDLVNISCSGMLVEGGLRLTPATRLVAHVEGSFAPQRLEGSVVRCQVSSISGGALRYQFAIAFDERLDERAISGDLEWARAAGRGEPPSASEIATAPAQRVVVNRW